MLLLRLNKSKNERNLHSTTAIDRRNMLTFFEPQDDNGSLVAVLITKNNEGKLAPY